MSPIIVERSITPLHFGQRFAQRFGQSSAWLTLACVLAIPLLSGCLGDGGAVSVRWRIVERETGAIHDPRDVSDETGECCANPAVKCAAQPGWHVSRVRLVFTDPSSEAQLANPPAGLDATCRARELTTPFELPEGLYAIALRAFDPAAPIVIQAQSPSPELRTVRKAEIANLDVVELSVSVAVQ